MDKFAGILLVKCIDQDLGGWFRVSYSGYIYVLEFFLRPFGGAKILKFPERRRE